MNKKLYWLSACLVAMVWGCGDDAGLSGKVVETCSAGDGAKCSTEGVRVVCEGGVYVASPCESYEGCKAGECVRKCDIATYPTGCDGNKRLYCGSDGFAAAQACGAGSVCVSGACRPDTSAGLNVGDACNAAEFIGRCDGVNAELKCENNVVVSSACGSGKSCSERSCEDTTVGGACDATFTPGCEGLFNQIVCKDGVQTREPCESSMICRDGVCGTTCTEDLKACNGDGQRLICDENGTVQVSSCPALQTCVGGECVTTCQASYKGCSPDASSRMYCANGIVESEKCPEGFLCDRNTGACDLVASDAECTPETLPTQCNKDGLVVKCDNGKVLTQGCPLGQTCYLGDCYESAPCGEATYTPNCFDGNSRKVCRDSGESIEACAAGEICEGGVCQEISAQPECTDGNAICESSKIVKKCESGVYHQYYCKVETEVCNSGNCVSDVGSLEMCDAGSYTARCDANVRNVCENGYVSRYPCGDGQHCDSGVCYDDVGIGDVCDMTLFPRQCDENGQLLVCHDGSVEAQSCGDLVCVAGECVACNGTNYTPACADNQTRITCKGGRLTKEVCPVVKHCESGGCVDNPSPGEPCDPATFHAYCSLDGKRITCEGTVVTETACGGDRPYCLNDACVACNPAEATQCVAGTGGAAATMVACSATGEKTVTSCDSDQTLCFNNKCASCDPNTFEKTCPDESKTRTCNESGKIVDTPCGLGHICENGACRKACGSDADCESHYICDTDKKCTFLPECTEIGKIECSTEGGLPIIRQCAGLGLWNTLETCSASEVCGAADGTETLTCRGTECTGTALNYCSGQTPAKCVNGKLVKVGSACTGSTPECVDGACKPCKFGSADICRAGTSGTATYMHCLENNTYQSEFCDATQTCTAGKGCVSKCGEGFVDSCKADASGGVSRTRVVCDAESGKAVEKTCQYNEACEAGKCVARSGASCNAYVFTNSCIADSAGNIYLESCSNTGIAYKSCGKGSDTRFCGTIDGAVGCYPVCDQLDTTYCYHGASGIGEVGPCMKGTAHDGTEKAGIRLSASYCDDGFATSCFVSPTDSSKILFNYYSCEYLNNVMTTNSCDALTGTCKNFKATASCTGLSAKCDGNKAVTCTIDPANITASNPNGYIQVEETCSNIDAAAECATYTLYGVPMARCALEKTLNFGSTATATSTLGKCETSTMMRTVYKYNDKSGSTSWMGRGTVCEAGCETGKATGYSGKQYDYAYCK